MRLFRTQGFSLIEVLVAAGVFGLLAAVMGGSIISLTRQNAMLVDQLAAADLALSVTEVLKSTETEERSTRWKKQNCHGGSDDDCCVKVQANAFP